MIWTTYISLEKDHWNPFEVFHVEKSFRTKHVNYAKFFNFIQIFLHVSKQCLKLLATEYWIPLLTNYTSSYPIQFNN